MLSLLECHEHDDLDLKRDLDSSYVHDEIASSCLQLTVKQIFHSISRLSQHATFVPKPIKTLMTNRFSGPGR